MIVDLPDTTTGGIARALLAAREQSGAAALGRVLTLIVATRHGLEEEAIAAANDASREHPMRIIVLLASHGGAPGLHAQLRVGGDAGASEVIVLHASGDVAAHEASLVRGLLLPDAPVVTWWPQESPARPAASPLGRISNRRITDAASRYAGGAQRLRWGYSPGDTDLAWTRLTHWRAQLAAALDAAAGESVLAAEVAGSAASPSGQLLAAWLQLSLRVPVALRHLDATEQWSQGLRSVTLQLSGGEIRLTRLDDTSAVLSRPGQPVQRLAMPRRSLRECIAEELRRLGPDAAYGRVVLAERPAPAARPFVIAAAREVTPSLR